MKQISFGIILLSLVAATHVTYGQSGTSDPLKLESTIPLPNVQGRIDHLAIDLKGQRLFVAALGNNSLEVIDLRANTRVHTVPGLAEPPGIAYIPSSNHIFVANGKDGSVRGFDASSGKQITSIPYGEDADNLRYDPSSGMAVEPWVSLTQKAQKSPTSNSMLIQNHFSLRRMDREFSSTSRGRERSLS